MFRFLTRQNGVVKLSDGKHLLRAPRYADFDEWWALRRESRSFLQRGSRPGAPTI